MKKQENDNKYTNMGAWIAIGCGVGTALGVAFGKIGLGVAFGPAIGLMIWAIITNSKKHKE